MAIPMGLLAQAPATHPHSTGTTPLPAGDHSQLRDPETLPKSKGFLPAGMFDDLQEALKQPEKVVVLDLKGQKLTSFPQEIRNFKNLETLDLANNQIQSWPEWLGELTSLKTLAVNNNRLTAVPASIGNLRGLETLYLAGNKLSKIDPAIGTLGQLRDLHISGDGTFASFQPAIVQLKSLQVMRLWNFGITEIPADIATFAHLHTLCLSHNALISFPKGILTLTNLQYLNLGDNRITQLPGDIGQLKNLNYLGIFQNPIASLPVSTLQNMNNLEWLAAWETQIPAAEQERLGAKPGLQAAFTNEDIH